MVTVPTIRHIMVTGMADGIMVMGMCMAVNAKGIKAVK